MQYYVQTVTDPNVFEEVDEFTFKNRRKAVLLVQGAAETSRYTDNHVIVDDNGAVTLNVKSLTARQIGILARILRAEAPANYPGGFCRDPEQITFRLAKQLVVRINGENFVRTTRWSGSEAA